MSRTARRGRAAGAQRGALVALVALAGLVLAAASVSTQLRSWPTERPPRPLAPRDVTFPPYEIRTLENGLPVVVVMHHQQPAVSMRMLVRAGGSSDPPDNPGVASMVATLLDQGTAGRDAFEIADTIDAIGGLLGTGAATDLSFASVVVMKNRFELGLDLLADIVRNPAFSPGEIERQRQQVLSNLQVNYQDADYVANVVFNRLVYGFHPYGLPNGGLPETVAGVTRQDLVDFHRAHYVPNNAILAIVGDVDAAEAFEGAGRVFGGWPRRALPDRRPIEPPAPTGRVILIDRPGSVQTAIRVGQIGIPRGHPDFMAVNLAMKILGGEGSNRLHRVLRTERGLTYGASADMSALRDTGLFVAETDTRSQATAEVLRLTVDEFWRLQRERVFERELADAKAYLTGSFPLTIETPQQIATQVLNAVFYELPLEELETYRERVNAVTVDDIQRVAREYLRPDRLSIVLVGDAATFAADLSGAGFPRVERVSLDELDLTTGDFRRPAVRAAGEAAAALRLLRRF